ncbi:hypothetical protein ACVWZW_002623 [Bradyrhizobium sp. F1.13.4]
MRLACMVTRSELGLLLGLGFLIAADLVFARGITAAATIETGELAFQTRAHRVRSEPVLAGLRRRSRRAGLCGGTISEHDRAQEHGAGKDRASTGERQKFRHIRHSSEVTATRDVGGRSAPSHSRFLRHRHVVSEASDWA